MAYRNHRGEPYFNASLFLGKTEEGGRGRWEDLMFANLVE